MQDEVRTQLDRVLSEYTDCSMRPLLPGNPDQMDGESGHLNVGERGHPEEYVRYVW